MEKKEGKTEVRPKSSKYALRGKIDMAGVRQRAGELGLRVYAVRDGRVLGTAVPAADGSFVLEFVHALEMSVGIKVVVGPDVAEKYYGDLVSKSACMETLVHKIGATQWKKGGSWDHDLGTLIIDPGLIDHWVLWTKPFHVHGRVRCASTGHGISYALVDAYEVDALPAGGFHQDLIASTVANACGNFHLTFPWFLVVLPQARPDLIFRVSQNVDGAVQVIYSEDPADTRWDMVDGTWVQLWVERDKCFTFNDPDADRPGDTSFLFTRVGLIGVDRIDANGYAESSLLAPAGNEDAPWGSTLHLCGWFGELTDATHYRIQYCKDGGAWKDITDPLSNKYYAGGGVWVTRSMGPQTLGGTANLYTTPYFVDVAEGVTRPWWFPDLMAAWDTTKAEGDGRYTIRILGYRWDGVALHPAGSLVPDPFYGEIKLRIDNSPPASEIQSMLLVHAHLLHVVQPCDILDFGAGDSLIVRFRAYDANGHLGGYALHAMYGHNCYVTPAPAGTGDSYPAHIGPAQEWHGGNLSASYLASDYGIVNSGCVAGNMPTCAYQFRLGVWKRTTNGYGLIYPWVEDTTHVTIKRV